MKNIRRPKKTGFQAKTCGEGAVDIAPGGNYFDWIGWDGTIDHKFKNIRTRNQRGADHPPWGWRWIYFLTVIFFFTVLPPAFFELTLKDALVFPGFFSLTLTSTALLLTAAILPTAAPKLTPPAFHLHRPGGSGRRPLKLSQFPYPTWMPQPPANERRGDRSSGRRFSRHQPARIQTAGVLVGV